VKFIDFDEVKTRVSIEDAVSYLGLEMSRKGEQYRSACPHCGGGPRTLAVTPSRNAFFCFSFGKGGDCIALVAHVLNIGMKDAAQKLWEEYCTPRGKSTVPETRKGTVPEERQGGEETQKLQPLSYLEFEHDAVIAVGFDTGLAKELGIGYAAKGIMRGLVAIPVRDEDGVLRGYVGVDEARLPKDFMPPENVVPFKKKA
jgi:DNA primase